MKRFGFWAIGQLFFDGEGGGGAGAGAGGDGGGGTDDKISLTKAELEGRIASAVALASKKAKREADESPDVKAMRDRIAEIDRQELERKGEYEKALASQKDSLEKEWAPKLTAEQERANKLASKLRENVVGLRLSDAAGKLNAVNPGQVRQLLDTHLKLDDNHDPIVVDGQGNPRFVGGKPMTADQLVKEFLDANPHMVRAQNTGDGGGAGGGRTMADGTVTPELAKLQAAVEQAEKDYKETGSQRALAAFSKATRELDAAKKKVAA
jgi:hypothetical protein